MNVLNLYRLRLKNFKGIKEFAFEPGGRDAGVYGDNATGKTTLQDAFCWLFFGKDSTGKADFQIKPVDESGAEIHNLDTEVEARIDYNGKDTILMKRYKEKWTKKRGAARAEFTGHTTDYFVNDVPAKKKDFDAAVNEIIDAGVFNLVTDPLAFNSMHWEKRRAILLEMCGDVPDQEVIDSDKNLKALSDILNGGGIDDHRKKVKAKQREINDELKQIPARIDEHKSEMDVPAPDAKEKNRLYSLLEKEKARFNSIHTGEQEQEKRRRIAEIDTEISQLKKQSFDGAEADNQAVRNRIQALEAEMSGTSLYKHEEKIARLKEEVRSAKAEMERLRQEYISVKSNAPDVDDTCPTCGQSLPEDAVQETVENFNTNKARLLEDINRKGKALKDEVEYKETEAIPAEEKGLAAAKEERARIEKEIAAERDKLVAPKEADTSALEKEKSSLQMELDAIRNGTAIKERDIKRRITELEQGIADIARDEAAYQAAQKSRDRIQALEQREKDLAAEYERLEGEMNLIERFVVKKVEMLEGKINDHFKLARFKLFETQINEGIKETCETIYNGVPYNHGLNNGARLNVGIDIIDALSRHYGFRGPIWIDNAESTTSIVPIESQVICLIVADGYNVLHVSQAAQTKRAS